MTNWPTILGFLALGYGAGSICWGHVFARLHEQPLEAGEHPGAAATWRRFGPAWGVATALLDVSMVAGAMFVAHTLDAPFWVTGSTGLAAAAGHMWPLYFRFQGGHAISSLLGTLFGLGRPIEAVLLALFGLSMVMTIRKLRDWGYALALDPPATGFATGFVVLLGWFYVQGHLGVVSVLFSLAGVAALRSLQDMVNDWRGIPTEWGGGD